MIQHGFDDCAEFDEMNNCHAKRVWLIGWVARELVRISMACVVLVFTYEAQGFEIDGFTEPHRTIRVAFPESGIITKLHVQEGDTVDSGQVLSQLDDDVHLALLAIAEQGMNAVGRRDAAEAELVMRKSRLKKFEELRASGHARQEELERARSELAVAEGQRRAAEEDLLLKRLEYRKIKTQLSRRKVRSPISGIVSDVHKEVGEFVAANSPEVVTVVQLDPLIATFLVSGIQAEQLRIGEVLNVRMVEVEKQTKAEIRFIAPVTDAESGTVRIEVRIDNSQAQFRSGERCVIELPDVDAA